MENNSQKTPFWAEVDNTYTCTENEDKRIVAMTSIDGWERAANGEAEDQGKTIAKVLLTENGEVVVVYIDMVAATDEEARAKIIEAEENLRRCYKDCIKWHGITRWSVEDLIGANPALHMSQEDAKIWWEKNEVAFKNLMTEHANEVILDMLAETYVKPQQ